MTERISMLTISGMLLVIAALLFWWTLYELNKYNDTRREQNIQGKMFAIEFMKQAIKYLEQYGNGRDLEYARARVILLEAIRSVSED
jgi:hypothetical protein